MKVDLTEDIRTLDLLDGLVRADRVDLEKSLSCFSIVVQYINVFLSYWAYSS